jgi:hypothetical protein
MDPAAAKLEIWSELLFFNTMRLIVSPSVVLSLNGGGAIGGTPQWSLADAYHKPVGIRWRVP